jgi:hypothetical protein
LLLDLERGMRPYIDPILERLMKKKGISDLLCVLSFLLLFVIIFSCGKQQGAEFKSNTNSPPVILSVNISPEAPRKDSELNAFVRSQDPNGDSITYQYQWVKNEDPMTGEDKSVLKDGNLKKGDLIRVRVIPSDGKDNGKPFLSDPVKILNSAPAVREVLIEPKVAYVTDRLKVNVKGSDIDGDSINYTYKWEMKGEVLNEERGEFLERGRFKKGDTISVTVTANDVESVGMAKKSEPVTIVNSPPIITSFPPNKIEGNIYTYQVVANDPDNDPIVFALRKAPKGMEINEETGLIRWGAQKGDRGKHSIEIEASDCEGAKSLQKYTLSIEVR